MVRWTVLCCLALATIAAAQPPLPPNGTALPIPAVTVDLDQDPATRWAAVVTPRRTAIQRVVNSVTALIPKFLLPVVDRVVGDLDTYVHAPYADEIRAIATLVELPLADVVVMNLFYELTVACTSIVCQDANGTIIHGRNMDYDVPGLQEITIDVQYTRGGAPAYRSVTYAGYVGVLTGVRAGVLAVTVDERDTNHSSLWANAAEALLHGGRGLGLVLRDTLDAGVDFTTAVGALATVPLIAPSYVIMSGPLPGQGAVVTRERYGAVNVWRLAPPAAWYLVETNYDNWLPDPASDPRRTPAEQRLNATGPAGITPDVLFHGVLAQFPNLNSMTVYTAVMEPASGSLVCASQNNQG